MSERDEYADFEEVDNEKEGDSELYADFENLDDLPGDDEILKLTEYEGNLESSKNTGVSLIAEYQNIDIVKIDQLHKQQAKNFVTKITKFILDFKDVELTPAQQKYMKDVALFNIDTLTDLMSLVTMNKGMLDNIVARVNAVQAEDYAMIATYNALVTQHLKLIKELQTTYKGIPSLMKKMRTEILCNQELGDLLPMGGIGDDANAPITEDYGTTQFNSTKQMLKELRAKHEKKTES